MRLLKLVSVFMASLLCFSSANAQSLDDALESFKAKSYEEAAFAFYEVLQNDPNADNRDKAEIYLAETLYKLELFVPALFYYTDIFKVGRTNRYYLNSVDGLLRVQEALHDWILVPSLVNENLDPEGFGTLDHEKIARVNYMIGHLSFTQGRNADARSFLEYVPPESSYHAKARYLLGVLEIRLGNGEAAIPHFQAVMDFVPEDSPSQDLLDVRGLAQLASGRTEYGLGHFEKSAAHYGALPRFSRHWFTGMYESAWSYFKQEEYGKALGELHTVTAPYFSKRHIPEAYVIQGTTYFINCQWDRVRRAVGLYKSSYEPMLSELRTYLEEKRESEEFYRDVLAGGSGKFSVELAREVRRTKRFLDYHYMLTQIEWEGSELATHPTWTGTRLATDLEAIIVQHREELEPLIGVWVKRQLVNRQADLQNFQSQIDVLDFELTDAESEWLGRGREILKGRRRRLPRPDVPNDQWQHWSFESEYWKGELGYYHYSIRSECE